MLVLNDFNSYENKQVQGKTVEKIECSGRMQINIYFKGGSGLCVFTDYDPDDAQREPQIDSVYIENMSQRTQ